MLIEGTQRHIEASRADLRRPTAGIIQNQLASGASSAAPHQRLEFGNSRTVIFLRNFLFMSKNAPIPGIASFDCTFFGWTFESIVRLFLAAFVA